MADAFYILEGLQKNKRSQNIVKFPNHGWHVLLFMHMENWNVHHSFIHQRGHWQTLTTSPHGFTHIRPTVSEKSASFKSCWLNWVIWCEMVLCINTDRNDKQRIWIRRKGVCQFHPYRHFHINSHLLFTVFAYFIHRVERNAQWFSVNRKTNNLT